MKERLKSGRINYRCDFCKAVKPEAQIKETRRERYCIESEKLKQELICDKCLKDLS